jgi:RNA polymerase sigma-70 factor (ECF subfamily)
MAQSIPLQELNHDDDFTRAASPIAPHKTGKWAKRTARDIRPNFVRAAIHALQPHQAPAKDTACHFDAARTTADTARRAAEDEAARALAAEVRKAQAGDTAAMTALIENNRVWVRGIAYSVLGDAHLAEDAAQEVCVRVVRHLRGLDTPEAFRPWVYRMTRNVALSMAQRRERTPQPLSLEVEQLQNSCKVSRGEAPGACLENEEGMNSILETIHRLPEIYREVLVLKHVRELSYHEMSGILGVSVKSLEVRLVRARKLLQDRLGRRFERGRKRDPSVALRSW